MTPSIHQYIKQQEASYQADKIRIGDNWEWNMRDHIQLIFHLKNGIFYTGENNWLRAFKNTMEPILELSHWTEDIDVKDTVFYVEGENDRVKSFFIKKYHDEVFVRKHNLETLYDELTESDVDYGGALVQRGNTPRPELIELNMVAFCDQTDILGGPIGFVHHFSPDKLRTMSKAGWGEDSNGATISLEELITLAESEKDTDGTIETKTNKVPGKTIEVYIVRGNLPEHYLKDNDNMEDHYNQLHVSAFYTKKDGKKEGVTLYRKKEKEGNLKLLITKKVHGRGLGRGIGEKMLHPQIWMNFLEIHKMGLAEVSSKTKYYTDDPDYENRNRLQDMDNEEITVVEQGRSINQIPNASGANYQLLTNATEQWSVFMQTAGSAQDPLLGKEPVSGTTFRGQERTVAQGRGPHDKRRGQRAKFIEELYRDWIIPDMVREIVKGQEFIATLDADEVRWVYEQIATKRARKAQIEALFEGELPGDEETLKQFELEKLQKGGNKQLLKIVKKEMEGVEIRLGINVAGKQKKLADLSDNILSIFQFAFADPDRFMRAMQFPALAKGFQDILEFAGMNQADFMSLVQAQPAQQPTQAQPSPVQGLPQLQTQVNQPQAV